MFQYRIVRLLSAACLMGFAYAIRWWFDIELERFALALALGLCGAAAGGMIAGRSFAMIFAALGGIFSSAGDPVLLEPMFATAALVGLACVALFINWSGVVPPLVPSLANLGQKDSRESTPATSVERFSPFWIAQVGLAGFCLAPQLGAAGAYAMIWLGQLDRLDQFEAVLVWAVMGAAGGVLFLLACAIGSTILALMRAGDGDRDSVSNNPSRAR